MGFWGYAPYVSVAARRAKAEKAAAKAAKAGKGYAPIAAYRGAIAKTFWGKAWCDNLERYSDYANRLPRGRTYVRSGAVIDLQIGAGGSVAAKVMGSSLYEVEVKVAEVAPARWKTIGHDLAGSIDSMVELLQGKLSQPVMERICKPQTGLFPAPADIKFSCRCPDWAGMCKHVAAVLYGVGARLDQQPEVLFQLRGVDARDLIAQASAGLSGPARRPAKARVLDDAALADVFGLELDGVPTAKVSARKAPAHKSVAKVVKPVGKAVAKKAASGRAAIKSVVAPQLVAAKPAKPAKASKPAMPAKAAKGIPPIKAAAKAVAKVKAKTAAKARSRS